MSQTVPGTFILGASKTGLAIGYRVLNLDRTTYSAFSTTGVSESAIAGTYYKADGVIAPDAGGYIVVGTSGTDMAEDEIKPAAPTVAAIQSGLSTLTTTDIDNRLVAYDAATGAEAAAILAAIAALNNLSSAGAQAAAAAALTAYHAATAEDVTALAQILAVTNPDPDDPGEITIQRGTTIDREITVEIIPASWTSARLTVKRYIGQADSEAVLQILVSATPSAGDGLQTLNGSVDVTKSDASLTVTYATGKATFHLEDALTAALSVTKLPMWWDIKFYHGSSDSVATMPQHFNVTGIVTEAV